jgi:tRNA(Ile2)-agmatinylcytidine synthase
MKLKSPSRVFQIGFDDTDSSDGMCTTFLCYTAVKTLLRKNLRKTELLDYPHLIRLNPNIPWKTRGNAALSIQVKSTIGRDEIFRFFKNLVTKYATSPRANSGLVVYEGISIPAELEEFSKRSLYSVMSLREARSLANKFGIATFELRSGQGLVGALSSIGNQLRNDHTFELIGYRKDLVKKREIDRERIIRMSKLRYPGSFNNYDESYGRVMILPHGPDPVLCGIRGETPEDVLNAFRDLLPIKNLQGYMIFRSNQATGEHLQNTLNLSNPVPYSSGTVIGTVLTKPTIEMGGHVFFKIYRDDSEISCACYEPTADFRKAASELFPGDLVEVSGGIRKPTSLHSRILNLEQLRPLKLSSVVSFTNPKCPKCCISLKSKGKNQGFACKRCDYSTPELKKTRITKKRQISLKLYVPPIKAHRHLTKPIHRFSLGRKPFQVPVELTDAWYE